MVAAARRRTAVRGGAAGGAPVRGAGVRPRSSWRRCRAAAGIGRVGRLAGRRDAAASSPSTVARRPAGDCRAACGSAGDLRPRGAHGRGLRGSGRRPVRRRAGEPAPTSTSPPTCGTTRRPRRSSTGRPAWSTSRTGPASGRGWPTASGCSAAGSADRADYGGDAGVSARHRPVDHPHRRPEPGVPAESRRLRPASPARRPGAGHPDRPARPPASHAARARRAGRARGARSPRCATSWSAPRPSRATSAAS